MKWHNSRLDTVRAEKARPAGHADYVGEICVGRNDHMSINGKKNRITVKLRLAIAKCVELIGDIDDPNSVRYQLIDLTYNDTIYRCFNEGLRLDTDNPKRPKAIVSLIHETFFASQLLAVRRLLDRGEDVHSLRKIFDIVNANRSLYSREGFIFAKQERISRNSSSWRQEAEKDFMHKLYDSVSNKRPDTRNDEDGLWMPHLEAIGKFLDKPSLIHKYTDSFIAHAIKGKKHRLSVKDLEKVNLGNLQRLYQTISWLCYTLSRYIGELILFEVPTVTFDQFEGWSGSFYAGSHDRHLTNYWNKRTSLVRSWQERYWDLDKFYLSPRKEFFLVEE